MEYFKQKVVWITGASSGIGEALAYELANYQATLILSARRVNELERVQEKCLKSTDQCYVYPLDLGLSEKIEQVAREVIDRFGHIDILVNNGGMSMRARAQETELSVDRKIMEINFFGQIALTKVILPAMIARNSGHLVIVSSIAGKFGFPTRSTYAASKHALHGYFDTLRLELAQYKIAVTLACPGRVNTSISLHALTKDGTAHGKMDKGQQNGISSQTCAQEIVKAVAKKKREVYMGGKEVILVYVKRYFPGLFHKIISRVEPS